MSEPQSIAFPSAARPDVRGAIARAAQATGVDFNYLLAQAKIESSLNPAARAPTSSAAGLFQFTNGTWLRTLDKHAANHGLDWVGQAIDDGRITDPSQRARIMAMRFDPSASALMAAELANDNKADLAARLGREPDLAELYLAHFLGSAGAGNFLTALAANPNQSAANILPQAAAANRGIFYGANGARSLAEVMELLRGKVVGAMEGGEMPEWSDLPLGGSTTLAAMTPMDGVQVVNAPAGGPIAQEFHAARQQIAAATASAPGGRSMADTLRNTFAMGDPDGQSSTPAHIRAAYSQLQRFNL